MEKKEFIEIIEKVLNQYQKEMNLHVEQFGKGKNRNIDSREKGVLLITPVAIKKRLLKELQNCSTAEDKNIE